MRVVWGEGWIARGRSANLDEEADESVETSGAFPFAFEDLGGSMYHSGRAAVGWKRHVKVRHLSALTMKSSSVSMASVESVARTAGR